MNMEDMRFIRVSSKDHIPFQCTCCGECCRHVKLSVPLESLDVYRMAKHLRTVDHSIKSMDDFLDRYAEPALLDECGYFVYFLKVQEPDDACIFLENSRCTIHVANPRACRTYPFTADPGTGQYLLTREKEHHFSGPPVKVKVWMKERFSKEDREYVKLDYGAAKEIAILMRSVPEIRKTQAVFLFLRYKYSEFDLDKPFLEQFRRNQERLIFALRALTK